jgi:hypothetical protein
LHDSPFIILGLSLSLSFSLEGLANFGSCSGSNLLGFLGIGLGHPTSSIGCYFISFRAKGAWSVFNWHSFDVQPTVNTLVGVQFPASVTLSNGVTISIKPIYATGPAIAPIASGFFGCGFLTSCAGRLIVDFSC